MGNQTEALTVSDWRYRLGEGAIRMSSYRDIAWQAIQQIDVALFKRLNQPELQDLILEKIHQQHELASTDLQQINEYLSERLDVILSLQS